jgi:hypothetical protein
MKLRSGCHSISALAMSMLFGICGSVPVRPEPGASSRRMRSTKRKSWPSRNLIEHAFVLAALDALGLLLHRRRERAHVELIA